MLHDLIQHEQFTAGILSREGALANQINTNENSYYIDNKNNLNLASISQLLSSQALEPTLKINSINSYLKKYTNPAGLPNKMIPAIFDMTEQSTQEYGEGEQQ